MLTKNAPTTSIPSLDQFDLHAFFGADYDSFIRHHERMAIWRYWVRVLNTFKEHPQSIQDPLLVTSLLLEKKYARVSQALTSYQHQLKLGKVKKEVYGLVVTHTSKASILQQTIQEADQAKHEADQLENTLSHFFPGMRLVSALIHTTIIQHPEFSICKAWFSQINASAQFVSGRNIGVDDSQLLTVFSNLTGVMGLLPEWYAHYWNGSLLFSALHMISKTFIASTISGLRLPESLRAYELIVMVQAYAYQSLIHMCSFFVLSLLFQSFSQASTTEYFFLLSIQFVLTKLIDYGSGSFKTGNEKSSHPSQPSESWQNMSLITRWLLTLTCFSLLSYTKEPLSHLIHTPDPQTCLHDTKQCLRFPNACKTAALDVLALDHTASNDTIAQSLKRFKRQCHPDRNKTAMARQCYDNTVSAEARLSELGHFKRHYHTLPAQTRLSKLGHFKHQQRQHYPNQTFSNLRK